MSKPILPGKIKKIWPICHPLNSLIEWYWLRTKTVVWHFTSYKLNYYWYFVCVCFDHSVLGCDECNYMPVKRFKTYSRKYSWLSNDRNIRLVSLLDSKLCAAMQWYFTVLLTSLRKTFFSFCVNENKLFWLTISYQNHVSFLFLWVVLKYYSKTKMAKNWSDLWNFYSKMIF